MLVKMRRNWIIDKLSVEVQNDTASMENSLSDSYKTKNTITM